MIIYRDKNQNLNVYVYPRDHFPAHVHIYKGSKNDTNREEVKISLGSEEEKPSIIEADESMRSSDIKAALELVFDKQQIFLEEWVRIHGIPKLDNKRGGTRRSNRKS